MFDRPVTGLSEWLSGVPHLAELIKGSTVSLAVTGLSRAGKTVFITSLVHNLLSALHQPHRMPLLKAVGDGRLVAATCCLRFKSGVATNPCKARFRLAGSPLPGGS